MVVVVVGKGRKYVVGVEFGVTHFLLKHFTFVAILLMLLNYTS
jgi:hypothetical protein